MSGPNNKDLIKRHEDALKNSFNSKKNSIKLFCSQCRARTTFKSNGLAGASNSSGIRGLQIACQSCSLGGTARRIMLHLALDDTKARFPDDQALANWCEEVDRLLHPKDLTTATSKSQPGKKPNIPAFFQSTPAKRARAATSPDIDQTQLPTISSNDDYNSTINELQSLIQELKATIQTQNSTIGALNEEIKALRAERTAANTDENNQIPAPEKEQHQQTVRQSDQSGRDPNSYASRAARAPAAIATKPNANKRRIFRDANRMMRPRPPPMEFELIQFRVHDTRPFKMAKNAQECNLLIRSLLKILGINKLVFFTSKIGLAIIELYVPTDHVEKVRRVLAERNASIVNIDPFNIPDYVSNKEDARHRQITRLAHLLRSAPTRNLQATILGRLTTADAARVREAAALPPMSNLAESLLSQNPSQEINDTEVNEMEVVNAAATQQIY